MPEYEFYFVTYYIYSETEKKCIYFRSYGLLSTQLVLHTVITNYNSQK